MKTNNQLNGYMNSLLDPLEYILLMIDIGICRSRG